MRRSSPAATSTPISPPRIRTDHEATSAAEAREKLAKGMTILIREGSVSKDLHALAEVLDENTASFMALCTDDRNPLDIGEEGHLDFMIRTLIALGRPRHAVYRAASWSGANAFGLRDRGLVAPGLARRPRAARTTSTNAASQQRHRRRPAGRGLAVRGAIAASRRSGSTA